MDQKIVNKLEKEIEEAIRGVFGRYVKLPLRVPLLPSQHVTQLMAKAAVVVYEAAAERIEKETSRE